MRRKVIGIVGALVLASVGTMALISYVKSAHDTAAAGGHRETVWIVTKAIAEGTPSADMKKALKRTEVPGAMAAKGSVTDLADLKGLVTTTDLVVGEQILSSRFVTPAVSRQGNVPVGLLQTTVELAPQRALGGLVRPGDTVGVLLSFQPTDLFSATTHLELHKVLVTSVQVGPSAQAGAASAKDAAKAKANDVTTAPSESLLVTLALDAPSIERVVFAAEYGGVWLSREPANAPETGTSIVDLKTVYTHPSAR